MKPLISVVLVVLSAVAAHGQSSQPATAFEVADVRVSPSSAPFMTGGVLRETRYEIHSASMVELVRVAYGLDSDDKVVGGPPWLASKRFDVVAKAPAGSTTESIRRMLQSLLAERFGLAVHNDSKPISSFALTVGKRKLQLKETTETADSGCQGNPQRSEAGIVLYQVLTCRNMSMATLAENLPNFAAAYVTAHVVDQTELKGNWDFELKWTPRATLVAAGSDGITLSEALERVGLHLETQSAATAVIIVDRVNDKPTDNIADIDKKLPPPATEFEVAVIKPSAPDVTQPRGGIQPGGRIDVQGMTLQAFVTLAWEPTNN